MSQKILSKTLKTVIRLYLQSLKADHLPIEQAFLFGSYAYGRTNKYSDVDLCVVSSKFSDPVSAIQYLLSKRRLNLLYPIEPIGFNPQDFHSDLAIIHEIKKHGIRLI
ncbi:MAG: nucleotidyltransferase domain-containing protein [Candidatus Omnitrophica bacterium]|nr:nucleotidyltransferase domain-containing protein [Candidatus Omnitrophota bacterium]